jgi:hypothetical protein
MQNVKKIMTMMIILTLITSLFGLVVTAQNNNIDQQPESEEMPGMQPRELPEIATISKTVDIAPGEKYYAYLDYKNQTVVDLEINDPADNLPQAAKDALDLVPEWLHDDLEYTFTTLTTADATTYANYINSAEDPKYIDEIAYCIAYSHEGLLSWMINNGHDTIFSENAKYIYNMSARNLKYAKLVEKSDYTTLNYNSTYGGSHELARDIYYDHVVYPRTHIELPIYCPVDSTTKFWRTFFLDDDRYGKSVYDAVKDATTMYEAVEKLGDWIVNFKEFQYGYNYIQPIDIYLNPDKSSCGQYTIITGAMAKTALIPCTSLGTRSEDHVWNEFYDTKWIHWDTSLGDISPNELNIVDEPGTYDPDPPDGMGPPNGALGKHVSTVYIMNGDESIEQSLLYTPYSTLTINVKDKNNDPVDGAKIFLYPASTGGSPNRGVCIWGYTDSSGQVDFEIGNKLDYYVKSSHPDLGESPGGSQVWQAVLNAGDGNSYNYNIKYTNDIIAGINATLKTSTSTGTVKIASDFTVEHERQWGENEETLPYAMGVKYPIDTDGQSISFFICDRENFNKYESSTNFDAYKVTERVPTGNLVFETDEQKEWYAVISNDHSYATTKTVNFTLSFYFEGRPDVTITSPVNGTEIAIDNLVSVTGTVFTFNPVSKVEVNIDGQGWASATDTSGGTWSSWEFDWDTEGTVPGVCEIEAKVTDSTSKFATYKIAVILVDLTSPTLTITEPVDNSEFSQGDKFMILGTAFDNLGIGYLELVIDGNEDNLTNITSSYSAGDWNYELDTDGLDVGSHTITVRVFDTSLNLAYDILNFTLLEIIPPVVTITSPANFSVFKNGDLIEIKGTATDNFGITKLALVIEENEAIDLTTNLYPNGSWSYLWDTSPGSIGDGVHNIMVSAGDEVNNLNSANIYIVLDGTPPEVTIKEPSDGVIIRAGDDIVLDGNYSDNFQVVDLEFIFDNGIYENLTIDSNYSPWGYVYTLTNDFESGELTITVRVTDLVGLTAEDSVTIIIDAEDPVVDITEIEGSLMIGETLTFQGIAKDDIQLVKLELELDSGTPLDITTKVQDDGSWSYDWDSSGASEGELKISVKGTDVVDKIATDEITIKLISLTTDTDSDGMPDWWELEYGLNPDLDDSNKDKDRDDFTNLEEYLGKDGEPGNDDYSDPTDKSSTPFEKGSEPDPNDDDTGTSDKDSDSDFMIYIVLAIIVIVIVLVLVFVFLRKKKKDEEETEPEGIPVTPEGQVAYGDPGMIMPPVPPPVVTQSGEQLPQILPPPPMMMIPPPQMDVPPSPPTEQPPAAQPAPEPGHLPTIQPVVTPQVKPADTKADDAEKNTPDGEMEE